MNWVILQSESQPLPPVDTADEEGMLAIGGELTPKRLFEAYSNGIFPWYSEDMPVMWWSPDPRMVLYPSKLKVQRSMRPLLNKGEFRVSMNSAFQDVIRRCAEADRPDQDGTWIVEDLVEAYTEWHEMGYVHSFESWKNEELVGGFYGVRIGGVFYGESMFADAPNASKFAFIKGVRWMESQGIQLIDCQMETEHLKRFGAELISRESFILQMKEAHKVEIPKWRELEEL
ncbi:MAG: leucyl/phenylalanyl-tRNA--protein transferase [Flavobacteriia bacterium]|nr:leucyl/phenylalanyl-tRNA--protein transferase [Flavobacteriia bacterium]